MTRILILDNYDSFTYNLYHLVEAVMPENHSLTVMRNDAIDLVEAATYDKIIISPGPGLPKDAGITCKLIRELANTKSILGICLGHQAIAEVFGGKLVNLPGVLHGKAIQTLLTDVDEPLFEGCPKEFETGRYHSWVVDVVPKDFLITAVDSMDLIMGISHKSLNVKGLQFHPESVMTPVGQSILKNWVFSGC